MTNPADIKEVTLRDYIDLILRRKWTIVLAFVVVFSAAVYYNFTQPPVYESAATFIIENSEPMLPMLSGMKMSEPARPFEFYQAIITSRIFRETVSKDIKQTLADSFGIYLSELDVWTLLSKNLAVTNPEYSDFVELNARANDPQVAYTLAKIASSALKHRCQEIDQEESNNIVSFVNSQQTKALQELENVEKKLQEFKEKSDALIAGENGGLLKELVQMESELLTIQTQRELAESNLIQFEQRLKKLNLAVNQSLEKTEIPEIISLRLEIKELEDLRNGLLQVTGKNDELGNLQLQINDKKKGLVRLMLRLAPDPHLQSEGANILWKKILEQKVSEELNVAALQNRENFYVNLIQNFKNKHPNMLAQAMKINQLKRAKKVHENLHGFLLEKGEEAKIKAATGTGGIRIIDPPNWPQAPNAKGTMKNLLLGALLGLGLGVGLAFMKDYFDNTIRTPEDITGNLQLPVMGVIPFIKNTNGYISPGSPKKHGQRHPQTRKVEHERSARLISKLKPKDPIVETYRGLRTNIQFADVDQKLKTLLITSSRPEEGKTITAANLALSFAEVGLKTVLIDTDLRKPKVHTLFQIEREPGLLECLVREKSIAQVMNSIPNSDLKVIPAGKIPPNPTQILASNKMSEFIAALKQEHDIIIFDSPPLAAVTDPILMSRQVDGVVLVVRFEFTDFNVAKNAIETLKKTRANVVGAVLNSTVFTKGYGYYHQYYNYHQYYGDTVSN